MENKKKKDYYYHGSLKFQYGIMKRFIQKFKMEKKLKLLVGEQEHYKKLKLEWKFLL